jgi:histidinol-phosphate phosphatase family protein
VTPPESRIPSASIVIPTIGRPSLQALLGALAATSASTGIPLPPVVVVDDRSDSSDAIDASPFGSLALTILRSGGRGPAAARNVGWRVCRTDWVVFLDDDVLVSEHWLADLAGDLTQPPTVGGVHAVISVPLPSHRRPTDWERGTHGLETARWITADMAFRRSVLLNVGGFDERFPRAFREDSDIALRIVDTGHSIVRGRRRTTHPVRPAGWWASLRQQRGNADDVLMHRLHGPHWRQRAAAPLGRRPQHLATTALAVVAPIAVLAGRPRVAAVAAAGWAALTAEFSWRRIQPGPRDRTEVLKMVSTSAAIPLAASWWWAKAVYRWRAGASRWNGLPSAVLLDRDGTIVKDVPYNGDPTLVEPMPGAADALGRLRSAGIPLAVISNQSGVGRGLIDRTDVDAVNARIDELLGPFDAWFVCPHTDADACECRKPMPGMVKQAAEHFGVAARDVVVIGDIGADMGAARAAGAHSILVPTPVTLPAEVTAAPSRATTLAGAVDLVLSGRY